MSTAEVFKQLNQGFGDLYHQMMILHAELTRVLNREEQRDTACVKSQEALLKKSRELQKIVDERN
mgnify:CR=1 FL=1